MIRLKNGLIRGNTGKFTNMCLISYDEFIDRVDKVFPTSTRIKIESISENEFLMILVRKYVKDRDYIKQVPSQIALMMVGCGDDEPNYIPLSFSLEYVYWCYCKCDMSVEEFVNEFIFNNENSLMKVMIRCCTKNEDDRRTYRTISVNNQDYIIPLFNTLIEDGMYFTLLDEIMKDDLYSDIPRGLIKDLFSEAYLIYQFYYGFDINKYKEFINDAIVSRKYEGVYLNR